MKRASTSWCLGVEGREGPVAMAGAPDEPDPASSQPMSNDIKSTFADRRRHDAFSEHHGCGANTSGAWHRMDTPARWSEDRPRVKVRKNDELLGLPSVQVIGLAGAAFTVLAARRPALTADGRPRTLVGDDQSWVAGWGSPPYCPRDLRVRSARFLWRGRVSGLRRCGGCRGTRE